MVYIFLADGFEDIEAVQTRDLLLRAGIDVITVGVGAKRIRSTFDLLVTADITEDEFNPVDASAVVFPGGMPGAANLAESSAVKNAIRFALDNDIVIAAICAAPGVVLANTGVLADKNYTCYSGFEVPEGHYTGEKLCCDGKLITANGPAAAVKFAAAIAGAVASEKAQAEIEGMYQ